MEQKYWLNFYRNFNINYPSDFAKFCLSYFSPQSKILDVGCGNGRDSYFFGEHQYLVTGIDFATKPFDTLNAKFKKVDLADFIHNEKDNYDVKYCRFLTHSIEKKLLKDFLLWIKRGLLMIEARAKEDDSFIKDHKRNLIDEKRLLTFLKKNNFETIYFTKGKGLAVFKKQDPIIIRIIAKK